MRLKMSKCRLCGKESYYHRTYCKECRTESKKARGRNYGKQMSRNGKNKDKR